MRYMNRGCKVAFEFYRQEGDEEEQTFDVVANYLAPTPDVMYLPNGDPGYPGDPEEIEFESIILQGAELPGADYTQEFMDNPKLLDQLEECVREQVRDDGPDYDDRDD